MTRIDNPPSRVLLYKALDRPQRATLIPIPLDGGERSRSTISNAVHRPISVQFHQCRSSDWHFHSITNLHLLDGT